MKHERGMTLLEIVVAVALIAIVMLFLARGFSNAMFMSRQSDEYAAAARGAREKMEELVSLSILRYKRTLVSGNQYKLEVDPVSGLYVDKPIGFKFTEMSKELRYEAVGGPMAAVTATSTENNGKIIVSGPTLDPFGRLHPFKVYLSDVNPDINQSNPDANKGILPGLVDDYAGEVVLIESELLHNFQTGTSKIIALNTEEQFGRGGNGMGYAGDLLPRDGSPDGFNFFRIPIDLDGDGLMTKSATTIGADIVRVAVGVIVRWNGKNGPERYETWTILSRY